MKNLDAYNDLLRSARRRGCDEAPIGAVVTYPLSAVAELLPRSPEPPALPQLPPPAPRTLAEGLAWAAALDAETWRAKAATFRAIARDEAQTREDRADADDLAAGFERHAGFLIDVAAARRERGW